MSNEEFKEFDENEAVDFINNALAAEGRQQYDGDDLLLIIDAMYDYFEENDSFDSDVDLEDDVENVVAYVVKAISKDADNKVAKDDVKTIVLAEMEYEDSLND